jgi:alpha-L-rhamnosidase
MYQTVAGLDLDPREPGYRHIIFRPRPGGSIQWAEASLKTPFGEAAIRWELKDSQLRASCTVPEGCTATFLPPDDYCTGPKTIDAGRHEIIVTRDAIKAAG